MNKFNVKHFFVLFVSFFLIALLQHDFIDQTYHSVLSRMDKLSQLKFKVNDTDFSKGRLGNIQEINLQDLVKFHGHACDGLVLGTLGILQALKILYPDGIIDRTNTRIVSKPSPCLTDAAIYLTGARYQFNTFYVSDDFSGLYIIQRVDNGKTVSVSLKEGVKPTEIERLGKLAEQIKLDSCELDHLRKLEDDFLNQLLNSNPDNLFTVQELIDFKWNPIFKNTFTKTDILNKMNDICK